MRDADTTSGKMYGVHTVSVQEDGGESGPPLAFGVTLEKFTAHTVDEDGKQTFAKHNPMELLRKVGGLFLVPV